MASIDTFIALFNRDFARSNLFRVEFVSVPTKLNLDVTKKEKLSFLCKSCSTPNNTIVESKVSYMNKQHPYALGRDYDSVKMTFLMDNNYLPNEIIENWLDLIIDKETGQMEYRSTYVGEIDIYSLDRAGNIVQQYKLIDAFPINKTEITHDFSSDNTVVEVSVNFTYDRYIHTSF